LQDPISTEKKLDMVACTSYPSYGIKHKRIVVQVALGKKVRHYLQYNQQKGLKA
jgi:hypothetical protein